MKEWWGEEGSGCWGVRGTDRWLTTGQLERARNGRKIQNIGYGYMDSQQVSLANQSALCSYFQSRVSKDHGNKPATHRTLQSRGGSPPTART